MDYSQALADIQLQLSELIAMQSNLVGIGNDIFTLLFFTITVAGGLLVMYIIIKPLWWFLRG